MCVSKAGEGSREELELPFSPAGLLFSNVQGNNNQIEKKIFFQEIFYKSSSSDLQSKDMKNIGKNICF